MGTGTRAIQVIAERDIVVESNDGFSQRVRTLVQTVHPNGARAFSAFVESSPLFTRSVGGSRIVRATTDAAARVEREEGLEADLMAVVRGCAATRGTTCCTRRLSNS